MRKIFLVLSLCLLLWGCTAAAPMDQHCTLSINCATVTDNPDVLTKELPLPEDGWLLEASEVAFSQGESVLDVLKRTTREADLQLEFSTAPLYGSAYVEGIANLYELDCGTGSGWMYRVNGEFPKYGCSEYILTDGDVIEWIYTCNLGYDIGSIPE